jgi:hypothetical protein
MLKTTTGGVKMGFQVVWWTYMYVLYEWWKRKWLDNLALASATGDVETHGAESQKINRNGEK